MNRVAKLSKAGKHGLMPASTNSLVSLKEFTTDANQLNVEPRIKTVKLRAEARVTIQEIKSLGVLQTETCH